jgi:cholinesterase
MLRNKIPMTQKHSWFHFCWTLFLSLVAGFVICGPARAAGPWNALYVFGDSYSDSGAGYVDADGPTAVVYLARGLQIPFTYCSDADRTGKSLNFAVSGAKTGEGEGFQIACKSRGIGEKLQCRGIQNQVRDFFSRVQSGEIKFSPDHTLFFIAGGLNDGKLPTKETIANLKAAIGTLYTVGARHIFVALLPTRIPPFRDVGLRLNPALQQIPGDIHLAGLDVRLSHWGEFFDEILEHPTNYGLKNTTDACAGRALFDEDPTPKGDASTYYYYHPGHPSTAVHRVVGEALLREALAATD